MAADTPSCLSLGNPLRQFGRGKKVAFLPPTNPRGKGRTRASLPLCANIGVGTGGICSLYCFSFVGPFHPWRPLGYGGGAGATLLGASKRCQIWTGGKREGKQLIRMNPSNGFFSFLAKDSTGG